MLQTCVVSSPFFYGLAHGQALEFEVVSVVKKRCRMASANVVQRAAWLSACLDPVIEDQQLRFRDAAERSWEMPVTMAISYYRPIRNYHKKNSPETPIAA
jgi:hypothetical protein